MTNLIGIAPISSPTFSGVSTFDIINVGSTSIPTGTSYGIAVAAAAKATSLTITGSFTMTSTSLYYVSGTGIASGTTITNAVAGTDTTVITLSAASTASLTTSSTISISEVTEVGINLFSSGQSNSTASIVSYGGNSSLLSGTLDVNAAKINLNGSSYINGSFYVKNTFNLTGAAESYRSLNFETNGLQRFAVQLDNTPESGSNAGSNLTIASYDDTGAWLATALSIDRSTGNITFPNEVIVKTQTNDDNSTYPATTEYVQNQFTKTSISLGPITDIGTSTTYTVASAADSGVTSIVVTGQITYENWYGYAVSGTGIASGTQITASVYDSTAGTSTITLSLATTAALTTTSTIDVDMIIGTALQFHSNGSSNYDAEISSVGGSAGDLGGILNFTAGGVNFNSSGGVNFSSAETVFAGPLYSSNAFTVGSTNNESAQTINFLTSGNDVDYDVQLYATGGGTTKGSGALSIMADSLNVQSAMNIMQPSFNLGLNQTKAGATFINFFSNGDNDYADFTLQSYGGTTGAAGGGTVSLTCSLIQTNCNEVDMSNCSWGVMVPTPGSTDATTKKAVNMSYLTTNYLPLTGGTLTGALTLGADLTMPNNNNLWAGKWIQMNFNGSAAENDIFFHSAGGSTASAQITATGGTSGTALSGVINLMSSSVSVSGALNGKNINGTYIKVDTGQGAGTQATSIYVVNGIVNMGVATYVWVPTMSTADNGLSAASTAFVHTLVSSDPSLKENIVKLDTSKSLKDLRKIGLYSFDWKEEGRGHTPVGFISKDLMKVWPDTVRQFEKDKDGNIPPDSINVVNMLARLTDCIKEQQNQIDELKAKIDEFKKGN